MTADYLFVYGTLCRRANPSMCHYLEPESVYFGLGCVQAKLYSLGDYPAIVDSAGESDQVSGELYRILDPLPLFDRLDDYECCSDAYPEPKQYARETRRVRLANGDFVSAWMYIFNLPVDNLEHISSGDFCAYQRLII